MRSDKGISRALNDEAVAEIYRSKKEQLRMNATQIYENLVWESFLPASVSVDSVQRFIRHNDLKSTRDPNLRNRKAYEEVAQTVRSEQLLSKGVFCSPFISTD